VRQGSARPRYVLLGMAAFVLPLLIIASYVVPGPAALVAPAALEPVEGLIRVDGATGTPAATGHLYLAALRVTSEPRLGQCLLARLQTDVELVPRDRVVAPGIDGAEFEQLSQRLLVESQRVAEVVALRRAGAQVRLEDAEVLVVSTIDGTPAGLELQPGDVIEAADGETVQTVAELVSIAYGRVAGEPVELRVRRNGRTRWVTLPASHGPLDTEGPVLGTVCVTSGFDYQAPVTVRIDSGPLAGGPAAGLMYALGVYNALCTEDITRGHRIAGTGTLRLSGAVGPVDGIRLKVQAAEAGGAEYFLVPADQAAAAQAAARQMKIIPVRTFQEALTALQQLNESDHGFRVVPPAADTTLACAG